MGRSLVSLVGLSATCLAVSSCGWYSESSSGLPAVIQVEGGQAIRGSIADPPTTGSGSATLTPVTATIFIGGKKNVGGEVGPNANSVALGVAGDSVYYRVPALEPADVTRPDFFRFRVGISISTKVMESPLLQASSDGIWILPISTRSIDNDGNFGPLTAYSFYLDPPAIVGTLAVSLEWDSATDLDLHVLVPAIDDAGASGYTEVWSKARSADSKSVPPDGVLDYDSNANCQIDGRYRENVIWTGSPPVGHYIVRVAAASLCGLTSAAWWAYASVPGQSKGQATGVLTDTAARLGADKGTGITAFEFDFP